MDTNVPNQPQQGVPPVNQQAAAPDLLAQAMAQIDAVIAHTPSDPLERANQIHAIKDAYLRATNQISTGQ